jgi:two-component system, OmpR family, response regulator
MRLLLVENQAKMAGLLSRGLQEEGHTVDVALRAEDALGMAQSVPYDAIVLDLLLPGLHGLEMRRQLRARHVGTPLLAMNSSDEIEDSQADLDADAYLAEPFSFSELLARLHALG